MISSGLCSRSVAILKTQRGSKPGWEMDPPEQADKRRRGVAALWVIYFVIYLFAYLRIYLFTYLLITVGASPGWLSVCPAALSVSNFLTSPFCSRTIVFPAPKKLKKLEKLQEGGIIDYWLLLPSRKEKKNSQDVTAIYRPQSRVQFTCRRVSPALSPPPPHTPALPPPPSTPPFPPPRPPWADRLQWRTASLAPPPRGRLPPAKSTTPSIPRTTTTVLALHSPPRLRSADPSRRRHATMASRILRTCLLTQQTHRLHRRPDPPSTQTAS